MFKNFSLLLILSRNTFSSKRNLQVVVFVIRLLTRESSPNRQIVVLLVEMKSFTSVEGEFSLIDYVCFLKKSSC